MVTHDFECNLVLISKSECLKDSEIARARRANAICSLWEINHCLFTPNCTRKYVVTCYSLCEKRITESSARATCNLHSCYNFAHSQSDAHSFFMYIIRSITTSNNIAMDRL